MTRKKYVVWVDEVYKDDISSVGKTASEVGEMIHAKLPLPFGFVVTAEAFDDFLIKNNLVNNIRHIINLVNYQNTAEIAQASSHIHELIHKSEISRNLLHEIAHYYDSLMAREESFYKKKSSVFHQTFHRLSSLYKSPVVSIRASITVGDNIHGNTHIQAQQFSNISGENQLIVKLKEAWANLYSQKSLYYAHQYKLNIEKIRNAVLIMRTINAYKSGHAVSIDAILNNRNKIIIEAVHGLPIGLNDAKAGADKYELDKKTYVILDKKLHTQHTQYVRSGHELREKKVASALLNKQKLSDEEILKIAMLMRNAENYFYFPQSMEWALEDGQLYMTDVKPVTNINDYDTQQKVSIPVPSAPLLVGNPGAPGLVVGQVHIVNTPSEALNVKAGDMLVVPETNIHFLSAIKKAAAIITEKGGRTSYAAHTAMELGIPAVVGAEHATKILRQGMIVSVNGMTGEIFKGNIHQHSELTVEVRKTNIESVRTLTKIHITVESPEKINEISKLDVDGIGLLKSEKIFRSIGIHPKEFITQHKEELFIKKMTAELQKVVEAFPSKPVIYRACDFTTNEYRDLKGGILYEEEEANPFLGFRGASRFVENTELFALELKAVKKILELGYKNFHLMVPFVRVPWELIRVKELVTEAGLYTHHGFKLWIDVEIPATAILMKEFIDIGVDGVLVDINDLTSLVLGVDKSNPRLSHLFDTRNPAVLSIVDYILEACKDKDITCLVGGESVSEYTDLVERVIKRGATGLVVKPEAVHRTRAIAYAAEKKLHTK